MTDRQKNAESELRTRRRFLKGALFSTGGIAALAVTSVHSAAAQAPQEDAVSSDKAGYRETDHVRAYYAAARS